MSIIKLGTRELRDIEEHEIEEFIEKYTDLQEYLFPYLEQDIDDLEYNGNIILSSKYSVHFCSLRNCIIFELAIPDLIEGMCEVDEILMFFKGEIYPSEILMNLTLEKINWFIEKGFNVPLKSFIENQKETKILNFLEELGF